MANPTPYVPGYEYSGVEPIPGNQLDNDFENLKRTTDETIAALGQIRRSDGALNNGIVTGDSLSPGVANDIIGQVDAQILVLADQVEQDAAAAALSASNSATSATASGDAANLASQWAAKTDGPVAGGEFSAKYWAQQAAISAGLPLFESGSIPTVDLTTDIYVDNDGVYSWNGTAYARTDISKSVIALLKTQAAAIMGVGQSWQDVSAGRTSGTTYTNSTGKPILVQISGVMSAADANYNVTVAGRSFGRPGWPAGFIGGGVSHGFLVPPGSTYSITVTSIASNTWWEYR